jgi:pilus assembly protein CpaE
MSTILIIDDDINALKLLGYTLSKTGFEILAAQDGIEGLQKAEAYLPDLIVSDLMMPQMDGYEVTRRLRANPNTKHIPIIMLTAKSQVHDKVAGFEAGVDDYVTKPVMPAELIARIKAHLTRRPTPTTVKARAKIVGFLGAKGGVGLTTVMVNLGLAIQQNSKIVILVDFQTSRGTVSQQLGQVNNNLLSLLKKPPNTFTVETLNQILLKHQSGLSLLPALHGVYARYQPLEPPQAKAILNVVDTISDYVLVDLGTTINQTTETVLKLCHQICIVTEPNLLAIDLSRRVIQYLTEVGLDNHPIGLILVSRGHSTPPFTPEQIKAALKQEVWGTIPAAPELAYQAIQAKTPMIILQPHHITSQQIQKLVPVFI